MAATPRQSYFQTPQNGSVSLAPDGVPQSLITASSGARVAAILAR